MLRTLRTSEGFIEFLCSYKKNNVYLRYPGFK